MKQKGFSLITAIFVMVVFFLLGVTMVSLLAGDMITAGHGLDAAKSQYLSETAAYYMMQRFLKFDYNWDRNYVGWPDSSIVSVRAYPAQYDHTDTSDSHVTDEYDSDYNGYNRNLEEDPNKPLEVLVDIFTFIEDNYRNRTDHATIRSLAGQDYRGIKAIYLRTTERDILGALRCAVMANGSISVKINMTNPANIKASQIVGTVHARNAAALLDIDPTKNYSIDTNKKPARRMIGVNFERYKEMAEAWDTKDPSRIHYSANNLEFLPKMKKEDVYKGVYYTKKDATIYGGAEIEGTIIAKGDIRLLFGHGKAGTNQKGIKINENLKPVLPALVANGSIAVPYISPALIGKRIKKSVINGLVFGNFSINMMNLAQEELPAAPIIIGMEAIMEYNGALISNGGINIYGRKVSINYLHQVQLVPFFYNIDGKGNKLEDNNVIITKQMDRIQRWN